MSPRRVKAECEMCGKSAEYCCSGLDVPALNFCRDCARIHKRECPEVHASAAVVVRMGHAQTAFDRWKARTRETAKESP